MFPYVLDTRIYELFFWVHHLMLLPELYLYFENKCVGYFVFFGDQPMIVILFLSVVKPYAIPFGSYWS